MWYQHQFGSDYHKWVWSPKLCAQTPPPTSLDLFLVTTDVVCVRISAFLPARLYKLHILPGKLTAKTLKCLCSLGLMVKLPAVGFMQATYCTLWISFRISFVRSYLETQAVYQSIVLFNMGLGGGGGGGGGAVLYS